MFLSDTVNMAHRLVIRRTACEYCARCQSANVRSMVYGMITKHRSIYSMHADLYEVLGTNGYKLCSQLSQVLGLTDEELQRQMDACEYRLAEIIAIPDMYERTEDYVLLAADVQ